MQLLHTSSRRWRRDQATHVDLQVLHGLGQAQGVKAAVAGQAAGQPGGAGGVGQPQRIACRARGEGVAAIKEAVALAKSKNNLPAHEPKDEAAPAVAAADAPRPASALVVRNQVKLTLEGAKAILDGAEKKAAAMNLKANIAVVDDGGHLIGFVRMNGGRPASVATAITKAVSAATFRQPSGPIPPGAAAPDPILNLSIQNAAAAGGARITSLYGGVPVKVDDQVIGGVGVGGGTGEQDAEIARAGIDAFLKQLAAPPDHPQGEPKP